MTLATIRVIAHVAARPMLVVYTVSALLLLGATAIASADHGPANVTSLVIDPAMPTTIYAGTGDRGLLKSSNGAATWTPTGLASSAVTAVAIDSATTPATLYAGTSDVGVLKSTDGGATWTATGLGGVVQGVTVAPGVPGRVYAVVAGMGAFRSDTAGASWNPIEPPNALGLALAVDSVTAGTVYVGTSNGVYRSADGGTTWDFMGLSGHTVSTLVSHASALFAATQYGIFRSIGGGAWTPTERMPSAMDVQIPTTLYAGTASGVFKSLDGGDTWSAANAGLTDVLQAGGASSAIGPMAIDPTAPQIVFAATQLGLFKSMDSAGTWQHPVAEDCFNGIDDDGDGISDNYDPDCPLTCLMGEFCPGGYICNPNGYCEPHCGNGFKDGDEGGVDCGGSCDARCHIGQTCWVGSDCDSGICTGSICVAQAAVGAINLAPASVSGGTSSTGTVILTGAAPAAGIVVTLSGSNTAAATVPADVTVVAASTSAPSRWRRAR